MRTPWTAVLTACAGLVLAACQSAPGTVPYSGPGALGALRAPAATGPQFVGFWESWSDRSSDPFHLLTTVPRAVTNVDVAFSIADSNAISDPQNSRPLGPGMKSIHAHGGKVLLSVGGATSPFAITDVQQFESNLAAYFKSHPGYDGVDFDDENINAGTAQLLTALINATRTNFPSAVISFDAFMSGVDPSNPFETAVLQNAGTAMSYVNVMDYDQYGWKPTDHPNCKFQTGYSDDCYLDVIEDFANVQMPGGGTLGSPKVVMGLMIGPADDGAIITPHDAQSYGHYVAQNGYGGVMIWDVDRDGPTATGHPKGTYISSIAGALGL